MKAQASLVSRMLATTAFALTAWTAAAILLASVVIAGVLFWRTNQVLVDQAIAELELEVAELTSEFAAGGLTGLENAVSRRSRLSGPGLYLLLAEPGNKLAGNLDHIPAELADSAKGGVFRYLAPGASGSEQNRTGVAIRIPLAGGAELLVGRDIEQARVFAGWIKKFFLFGFGTLALAAIAASFWVSRIVLRRISSMGATARSIMSGDLSQRIALSGSGDELDDLGQNLNEMLERIEQLMHSLREVSDNIAHDLKTPLNRLRNRAEGALRDPRGGPAYRDGLECTIEEADSLIQTFNALLLIARLEAGAIEESAEAFSIADLVRDVGELYAPVAEEKGLAINLHLDEAGSLYANKQLVGQAVANLIDNAIKYGAGTVAQCRDAVQPEIDVRVRANGNAVEVHVGDHGSGINANERERVLMRFVRLDGSRTQPGTGLGLSLVAAVARMHGGTIRLEDNDPGLRVVLVLPRQLKGRAVVTQRETA